MREAERFLISDEEFEAFLDRHREVSCLVPESNQKVGIGGCCPSALASPPGPAAGARGVPWGDVGSGLRPGVRRQPCGLQPWGLGRSTVRPGTGGSHGAVDVEASADLWSQNVYTEEGEGLGAKGTEPLGIRIIKNSSSPATHTHRATLDPLSRGGESSP